MQKVLNVFTGSVRVEAQCRYGERLVNICAKNGIEFWDLERIDRDTVRMTVQIEGYRRLHTLARDGGFSVKPVKKKGAPFLLWRVRKRYALLAGMLLCVGLVWFSSLFVWEIQVAGNETVSTSEILEALDELGVHIGACRLTFSQDYISNEMLQMVPELCWITVNTRGSHADILVREEREAPEIVGVDTPTLVYAEKAGIITETLVFDGTQICTKGDTVVVGDVLVTGKMDSISSGTRYVHAMAEVYARTWYETSAQMPLQTWIKSYTGDDKTRFSLVIAGNRINLYFNSGNTWSSYDKIIESSTLTLPGGTVLPLGLIKETDSEYTRISTAVTESDAEQELKNYLLEQLQEEIGDGEIVETQFEVVVKDGVMTVSMTAECIEQIGAIRELTQEEMTESENTEESDNGEN